MVWLKEKYNRLTIVKEDYRVVSVAKAVFSFSKNLLEKISTLKTFLMVILKMETKDLYMICCNTIPTCKSFWSASLLG